MTLSDLGSLMVKDGSGEVAINGIRGGLTIEDGSGETGDPGGDRDSSAWRTVPARWTSRTWRDR